MILRAMVDYMKPAPDYINAPVSFFTNHATNNQPMTKETQADLFREDFVFSDSPSTAIISESGYARVEGDKYHTPPWVTQELFKSCGFPEKVWEPAAGAGGIVDVLKAHGFPLH